MRQGLEFSITIVRHGKSESNKAGYYSGHLDVDLIPTGVEQAKLTGQALKDEIFDLVISSDLKRAYKTVHQLLLQNNKTSKSKEQVDDMIKTDKLLRERNYGVMEGKNNADFLKKALELGIHDCDPKDPTRCFTPEGGESEDDVMARVSLFIKKLFANERLGEEGGIKHVLLASHSGWIRTIADWMHDSGKVSDISRNQMQSKLSNCAITQYALSIDPETRELMAGKCLRLYDDQHLIHNQ